MDQCERQPVWVEKGTAHIKMALSLSLVLVALKNFQGVLSQHLLPHMKVGCSTPPILLSVSTQYEEDRQEHWGWEGGLLRGNTVETGVFWCFLGSLWREARRTPSLGFLMAPLWSCWPFCFLWHSSHHVILVPLGTWLCL